MREANVSAEHYSLNTLIDNGRIVPIQDQPTVKYNNINTHQSSSLLICYTEGDVQ